MSEILQILICLLFSAFFSGMEMAYLTANRLRIELDRMNGLFSARIITYFTKRPDHYIVTILIGNNVVLVIYGLIIAKVLETGLYNYLSNEFYVFIAQTIISTLLILIAAEFIPKFIFRTLSNFFLNYLSIPVYVIYLALYPVSQFFLWISNFFIKKLGNFNKEQDKYLFGRVDLEQFLTESTPITNDLDTPNEIRIFRNALDFSKIKLRDCMVPRTDVEAVDINTPLYKLKEKFIETGFSKIVIYHDTIDNIVGYINIKDIFKANPKWNGLIIKAPIVPETMLASKMLKILLQEHKSLAVVVDEFGGTAGIVTIEDLIEEIFGEIEDEHDTDEYVEKLLSNNSFIFSGRLNVHYLNEKYLLNIPISDEYDTLAGFIMQQIGKIPVNNEIVEFGNFSIKILKTKQNRIDLLYLRKEN